MFATQIFYSTTISTNVCVHLTKLIGLKKKLAVIIYFKDYVIFLPCNLPNLAFAPGVTTSLEEFEYFQVPT